MFRYQLQDVVFDGQSVSGRTAFAFTVPVRTVNPLNNREHWRTRQRRVRRERDAVALCWPTYRVSLPCAVHLVRVAPKRNQLDDDAVGPALKGVRDEVARLIGVDDRDARVTWTVAAEVGAWAVRVEIGFQLGGEVLPPLPRRPPRKTTTSGLLPRARAQAGFSATPNFIPGEKKEER